MIRDTRVFRQEGVPENLHHRHSELQTLSAYLSPIEDGRSADPAKRLRADVELADRAHGDSGRGSGAETRHRAGRVDGVNRISEATIAEAVHEARAEIRQRTVSNLTRQQRVLFEVIEEHGEVSASDLHAAYEERVAEPRSERQRRNYLTKLERYNLIEREGERWWTTYRVVEEPVRS